MMKNIERKMNIAELSDLTGVSVRRIRFWRTQDLLPPPMGRGPGSCWGPEHLKAVRELQTLYRLGVRPKPRDERVQHLYPVCPGFDFAVENRLDKKLKMHITEITEVVRLMIFGIIEAQE